MYTNSDMTLYSFTNNGYVRHYIEKVFWQDSVQKNTSKEGSSGADEVYICIPETDNMVFTVRKDIVVKGKCELEFDNTSDKGISDSLKQLKKLAKVYEIIKDADKRYGSSNMQHYELNCR